MSSSGYTVMVVRAWTKETLAVRIAQRLEAFPAEDIVSISYFADNIITLFWRRNSALIVLRPMLDDE